MVAPASHRLEKYLVEIKHNHSDEWTRSDAFGWYHLRASAENDALERLRTNRGAQGGVIMATRVVKVVEIVTTEVTSEYRK